jgi:hypothetical protein
LSILAAAAFVAYCQNSKKREPQKRGGPIFDAQKLGKIRRIV